MSQADDLTGLVIAGKYELLRLIGWGGMGVIYEARASATLKRCAVKLLLKAELAGDPEVLRRFFREARASGVIQSEHVVAAFDSGIDQTGWPYYVMEYLVGEDLRETLTSLGPLSQTAATKIAFQAALGLAKAHELGIVHRDVKPANLFLVVSDDGEIKVKVLDFGVAKVKMEVFQETTLSVTRTGSILGTPLYMSPEQVRRASSIDASADVWSLGVLLFECLTGEMPWGAVDGFGELIAAILTNEVPMVQNLAPWVKPELAEIVHRAMSRDLAYRYRTAAELCDALRALLPSGARLLQMEIGPPPDSERRTIAPRLSLADTVMWQPTTRPSIPTRPVEGTARRNAIRVATTTAIIASVGATLVWQTAKRTPNANLPATMIQPASSAVPPEKNSQYWLEVEPRDAQVTIDGKMAPVVDGKTRVEGITGATYLIRVSHSGNSAEKRITLTPEGLLPSRIELPPAAKPPDGEATEKDPPRKKQPEKPGDRALRPDPRGSASAGAPAGGTTSEEAPSTIDSAALPSLSPVFK